MFTWGGSCGELMLVIKILGIFRCIFPVAKDGKLEANIGETIFQLQLVFTKTESGLIIAMSSDFWNNLGVLIKNKNILGNNSYIKNPNQI